MKFGLFEPATSTLKVLRKKVLLRPRFDVKVEIIQILGSRMFFLGKNNVKVHFYVHRKPFVSSSHRDHEHEL